MKTEEQKRQFQRLQEAFEKMMQEDNSAKLVGRIIGRLQRAICDGRTGMEVEELIHMLEE